MIEIVLMPVSTSATNWNPIMNSSFPTGGDPERSSALHEVVERVVRDNESHDENCKTEARCVSDV